MVQIYIVSEGTADKGLGSWAFLGQETQFVKVMNCLFLLRLLSSPVFGSLGMLVPVFVLTVPSRSLPFSVGGGLQDVSSSANRLGPLGFRENTQGILPLRFH